MAKYDGFKRDRLSAVSLLKQSLRNIWSSKISVAQYTNGLGIVMTTVHVMSKKKPVFYWQQASALHASMESIQYDFPHIKHKIEDSSAKKEVKKGTCILRCSKYYFLSTFLC